MGLGATNMQRTFAGKRVMVTGCCGTIGSELVNALLSLDGGPSEVLGIDNNESALFVQSLDHAGDWRARFLLCDLRDARTLKDLMSGVDIVLHAAALKHVVMCERSPMQAVQTNVTGLQNVIDAAIDSNVERMISTSSDKAVNPNSVMGLTKLLGERLISATGANRRGNRTVFSSTRFGNVVGSNGSVFHIFRNQIRDGQPITLSDPGMTRFVMSAAEAASLVLNAAAISEGGEVFVFRTMPMIRIVDLAEAMRRTLAPRFGREPEAIPVVVVGAKTGEKLHEQLMSEDECARSRVNGDYCVINPLFLNGSNGAARASANVQEATPQALRSDAGPFLSVDEISMTLEKWGLA